MAKAPAKPAAEEAPAAEKSGFTRLFFANANDGVGKVDLYLDPKNPELEAGRPGLFGYLDGQRISAFVQPGGTSKDGKEYSPFLTLQASGAAKEGGGYEDSKNIGTANVVVTEKGHVRLAMKLDGQENAVWATPRKDVGEDLLVKMGLDVERLLAARANAAKNSANEEAAPAKKASGPKP